MVCIKIFKYGLNKGCPVLVQVSIPGVWPIHHHSMVHVLRVLSFTVLVKVLSCVWAHECCAGSEDENQRHLKSGNKPQRA